jgi:DNA polymerase-3 subunit gamma/tau
MAYFVLARRLRPQGFDAIIGQAHVTRTLANELRSGRIGHAFLFSGTRGVGKTTTARILAKALNCEKGPTPDPCGACESCLAIAEGSAIDVVEIDGASNRGIDEIRDIQENVRYAPVSSRFKIFIIDEAHMITGPAFNALLKTLEEPPERVKFVLATTESHKVPATIRSRCQHFEFRLVPTELLLKTLEAIARAEELRLSARSLRLIARAGRGSVRDALSLLEQVLAFAGPEASEEDVASILGLARLEVFGAFLDGIAAPDVDLLLRTTERLLESGYDLYQITQSFLDYLRDLAVLASVPQPGGLLDRGPEEVSALQAQARRFELDTLLRYFQLVQQAGERLRGSTQPRPIFEMMLVGLTRVRSLQPVDELARKLAELERRLREEGGTPVRPSIPAPPPHPFPRPQAPSPADAGEGERPAVSKPFPSPASAGEGSGVRAVEAAAEGEKAEATAVAGFAAASPPAREPAAPSPADPGEGERPGGSKPFPSPASAGEGSGVRAVEAAAEAPAPEIPVPSPEPGTELDVLERVCGRLEAEGGSQVLAYSLRAAGVVRLGAETVLAVGLGQQVERQKLESAQNRPLLEKALAAELGLPHVRLRVELAEQVPPSLLARDAEERKRQELRWIALARSVEGVRTALEVFGGRIESVVVEEEDGELSTIAVDEKDGELSAIAVEEPDAEEPDASA